MGFRLFRDGQLQLALVQQRQKVPCTHHHLHLDLSIPLGKLVDRGGEQTGGNAGIRADTDPLKLFSFDFFKSFFQCGFRTQQFLHPGKSRFPSGVRWTPVWFLARRVTSHSCSKVFKVYVRPDWV